MNNLYSEGTILFIKDYSNEINDKDNKYFCDVISFDARKKKYKILIVRLDYSLDPYYYWSYIDEYDLKKPNCKVTLDNNYKRDRNTIISSLTKENYRPFYTKSLIMRRCFNKGIITEDELNDYHIFDSSSYEILETDFCVEE